MSDGVVKGLTQAERQREYRERQRVAREAELARLASVEDVTSRALAMETGLNEIATYLAGSTGERALHVLGVALRALDRPVPEVVPKGASPVAASPDAVAAPVVERKPEPVVERRDGPWRPAQRY